MAYAWLLAAYPRDYRRTHGAELLEPLLAESRRPTVREAANLLAHGLRTRLGRPASRTVVGWAVLATVIAGAFGTASGALAGWRTGDPVPGPAATRALLAEVLPGRPFGIIEPPRPDEMPGPSWYDAGDLLFGASYDDQEAEPEVALASVPVADRDAMLREAPARLAATGWSVETPVRTDDYGTTHVRATRDGLVLNVAVNDAGDADEAGAVNVWAGFERTTRPGAWIGGVAGGLLAVVAGFLIFAWASRRTGRSGHPARVAVVLPFGVAMVFWWAPALAVLPPSGTLDGLSPPVGIVQMWEWFGHLPLPVLFLAGAVFAVVSLILAALPRHAELRPAVVVDPQG